MTVSGKSSSEGYLSGRKRQPMSHWPEAPLPVSLSLSNILGARPLQSKSGPANPGRQAGGVADSGGLENPRPGFRNSRRPWEKRHWWGARAVYWTGLENQRRGNSSVGSNPTPTAKSSAYEIISRSFRLESRYLAPFSRRFVLGA